MKKIFLIMAAYSIITPAFGKYYIDGGSYDDCANNGSQCLWCLGGGTTIPSTCAPERASCGGKATIKINVGSSYENVRCTSSTGFCYTSCSETRWAYWRDGIERHEVQTGCKCDSWNSGSGYRCAAGYYGDPGTLGNGICTECPSVTSDSGATIAGNSIASMNLSITDCFIGAGVYADTSGKYEVKGGNCFYGLLPLPN